MSSSTSTGLLPQSPAADLQSERGQYRLKILFMVDELESISAGGSERQVLQLIELLRRAGHDVTLAVFRKSEWLNKENKEYPIYFCELKSIVSLAGFGSLFRFVRWMREQKFQIVQTMFREANLIGPVLARMAGVPVVLGSRRNLNHAMSRSFGLLQSISNQFATRLVANSECVKRTVARQERTPATKIDVIYNGVDTRYFASPASGTEIRERLGMAGDAVVVGVISRFGHIKGQDVFLNAAAKVLTRLPRTRFVMVGDGPTRQEIQAVAGQLNVGGNCVFVPAQRDIRPYLAALDIAVLPSRSEGFSNSLLEYMSAGLAIVATDVGGNRESLADTGVLVPPENPDALADAIAGLITDRAKRENLGTQARDRVRELFDLAKAQARISEYFQSLAQEHKLTAKRALDGNSGISL